MCLDLNVTLFFSESVRKCCASKGYEPGSSEDKMDCKESLRPLSQPVYTSSPIKNGNLKERGKINYRVKIKTLTVPYHPIEK